ncbi:MAG TPA: M14 family metallopeptidase, partial [Crenalkalicoccus sp.]|nr:M14 family metallopeptidase [Crenalkalicoccus sp.]
FGEACNGWPGAACSSHPVRYDAPAIPAAAPEDDLTIDLAHVTRGNPKLLILQSGLHGAEAFAGAAVLQRVFQRHLDALLDAGWDVAMIHAANPYGFRHLRRVDGNNVDLNRNFAPPTQPDFYLSRNPAYDALRSLAEPEGPVRGVGAASTDLALRTIGIVIGRGFDSAYVANGTHAGQWQYPRGFEYGGKAPAQQTAFWQQAIAPLMRAHPEGVVFFDLHTGLGPANTLTIYSGQAWPEARIAAVRRFVEPLQDRGIRFQAPAESSFQTQGDVIDFVPSLALGIMVTAVTLEWGTVGEDPIAELATNARMILENQKAFHGCADAATCVAVTDNFMELFRPDTDAFRTAVISQADAVLERFAQVGLPPQEPRQRHVPQSVLSRVFPSRPEAVNHRPQRRGPG